MEVEIITPCRECDACVEARKRLWRGRAYRECELWGRTWFGTLTLRPDEHYRFLAECRQREGSQGIDFDALGEAERLRLLDARIYKHQQLMLKRIREAAGSRIRFMAVCELHKSGLPHYHMLVHSCDPAAPLRYKHLKAQWKLGFSQWRLADGLAGANYVCKYINKGTAVRVRASQFYGALNGVANDSEACESEQTARF